MRDKVKIKDFLCIEDRYWVGWLVDYDGSAWVELNELKKIIKEYNQAQTKIKFGT